MGNFDLDFTLVQNTLYKNQDKIPIEGNKHCMVRVAFDLFRLKGDEQEDLWQVQADDDGEFLVRTYSFPEEDNQLVTSNWNIKEDSKKENFTIAYRGIPIQRFAIKDFKIDSFKDISILKNVFFNKFAKDKDFVFRFFKDLSSQKRDILKEAGFLKELKNWLTSQDITDDLMKKIIEVVEEEERPYKKHCPYKEQDVKDYEEFFKNKAKEYGSLSGSPQEIPKEKRDDFFNEIDIEWKAKNESNDLSALELELRLKKEAELPPELNFDISDVESTQDIEPAGSFLIDEDKINSIIEEIEKLSPRTQEKLRLRLK